jgi:hypothetical protein
VFIAQQPQLSHLAHHLIEEAWATSCLSSRRRFLVNTVGSKLGSIKPMSRNQRYRSWKSSSSQNARSLRIEYSELSYDALSSRSGGMDGRPPAAYTPSIPLVRFANSWAACTLVATRS